MNDGKKDGEHRDARGQTTLSRRNFLSLGGAATASVVTGAALGACSPQTTGSSEDASQHEELTAAPGHRRNGLPSFLTPPEPTTDISETREYDVVVIGAGASGVTAALSAHEAGVRVALLQKESTVICQGNAGSGINLETSDPAHVQNLVSLLVAQNGHRAKRALVELWALNSGEAVSWVMEKTAAEGAQVTDMGNIPSMAVINKNNYNINFITSNFAPKPYNAGDGMQVLADVAEEEGVEIFYSTPAEQLVVEEGKATGVIGSPEGSPVIFSAAKGVIVATGDYQNDEEMSSYYIPDLTNFSRKQLNKTGDGHKMVIWAGGKMEDIGHTKMLHDFDAGPGSMCDTPFLTVKNDGTRFVNETAPMSLINNYLRDEVDAGWYSQIFDSNYMEQAAEWPGMPVDPEGLKNFMPEDPGEKTNVIPGLIRTFVSDSLEELADKLELTDKDAFLATIKRYNELAAKGVDEDFGKPAEYLKPIDTPPFYGIHRWIRVSAICSGVEVNEKHQCLTPEGNPIEGLYAVGNCSGGFYGGIDYPLDVGGLSLGRCYTEGYIIGRQVAQS